MITVTRKIITTKYANWENIQEAVISHDIMSGDCIYLDFDGRPTAHDVIGVEADELTEPGRHSITVQMHDLLEQRLFDEKTTSIWESSDLRRYLNSNEFMNRYGTDLLPHLGTVRKMNSNGKITEDTFFLLSMDELDPEKTPYQYYENERNRVKFIQGQFHFTDFYWTRSAYPEDEDPDYDTGYVQIVCTRGLEDFSSSNAVPTRFAPACVIRF